MSNNLKINQIDPFNVVFGMRVKVVKGDEAFAGVVQGVSRTVQTIVFRILVNVYAKDRIIRKRWKPKEVSFRATVNNTLLVFTAIQKEKEKEDIYSQRRARAAHRSAFVSMRAGVKTPYEVLGVVEGADLDVCKKAFRMLARMYHPDISKEQGCKGKFIEVSNAWNEINKIKGVV